MVTGVDHVVAVLLDLLAALAVVVGVSGGGGAGLGAFERAPVVVVVVQLRHLMDLDRRLWRMFDVDVDEAGAEHWSLSVAVGQRQRVRGVDLGLSEAAAVLLVSAVDRHLAELPGEVGRALTLVSGAALPPVYTRQVTHHHSEVGRRQGVGGVAVLTDDRGGVPQLTVVVASASYAG